MGVAGFGNPDRADRRNESDTVGRLVGIGGRSTFKLKSDLTAKDHEHANRQLQPTNLHKITIKKCHVRDAKAP
ncbi:hypothetical protein Hypma_011956 [Hypsizygus marmoreus]|uniref:Uncharacterized protein n=1 Tax=Hypsizygus marmoreus TaxID=39966 RepID=A0A369JHZ3_HYPMA|nr:hypothetical protein Hypma_011956 [Hypsizygus marmoreus]